MEKIGACYRLLVIGLIAAMSFSASFSAAKERDLSSMVSSKKPVKVFLRNITNESGQGQIVPEEFKKSVEDALLKRKAVKFEIVRRPEASDVQIEAAIKQYQYLEKGPMKVSPSPSGILLDMAATAAHNYVEMAVLFTVIDTGTDEILWKDTVSAYIKKTMTPKESIPLIYDRVSRTFLWKSFGKPR